MKKSIAILLTILMLFSLVSGALRENVVKADETQWQEINTCLIAEKVLLNGYTTPTFSSADLVEKIQSHTVSSIIRDSTKEIKSKDVTNVFKQSVESSTVSQSGSSFWAKTFGGNGDETAYSCEQTTDGGCIVYGETKSFGSDDFDLLVVKLDSSGNVTWAKTYGGTNEERGWYKIINTNDGGYTVCGRTKSFGVGNFDILIVKLNSLGNIQWTKTFGGKNHDAAWDIISISDGGYILGAWTSSFAVGSQDLLVVKLDSSGNILWAKTYGGKETETGSFLYQTSDGGYILSGRTNSFGAGDYDIFILKLNSSGDIQWARTFGGTDKESGCGVQQTLDGGYIVTGATSSFGTKGDAFIIKLNSNGDITWAKTYGGSEWDAASSIFFQTSDGGFIIPGETASFGAGGMDALIMKLNSNGDIIWAKTYGGNGDESASSISQTPDGGFIVAGQTASFGAGGYDFLVLKLDSSGNIPGSNCGFLKDITSNLIVNSITPTISSPSPTVTTPTLSVSSPSLTVTSPTLQTSTICESRIILPYTPQNFTATVYSAKIVLNWNASTQGTNQIAGYAIWRATSPDFDFINSEPFARVPANTTSFTDLNISAGKYYYRLRAYDNQATPNYSGFTYKLPVFTYEAFKSVSEFSITPDDGVKESTFSSDRVKVTFSLREVPPNRKVNLDLLYVLNSSSNQVAIDSFQEHLLDPHKLQTVWEYPKILGNKEAGKPFELENFKLVVKIKSYSITGSDSPVVFYDNLDIESHKYSLYSVAQPASNSSLNPPGFLRNRDGYKFINDKNNFYPELINTKLHSEINSLNLPREKGNSLLDFLEIWLAGFGVCRGFSASAILYREAPYVKPNKENTFDMLTSDARVIDNILNYQFNSFFEEIPTEIRLELLKRTHLAESSNINSSSFKSLKEFIRSNKEALIQFWHLGKLIEDFHPHAVAAYQLIKDEDNGVSCVGIYDPNFSNDSGSTLYFEVDSNNVLANAPFNNDTFITAYPGIDFLHLNLQKAADLLNSFLILFRGVDIVFPHSPINILIADSNGRKLGYVNGKIINEIPGASYSQLSDTDVVYYVPSGISYTITTTGTESGTFGLDVLTGVENNRMKRFVTYENVPTVKNAHSEVSVSPTSSYTLNVDTDGNGTFDTQKTASISTAIAIPPDSPLTLTASISNNSITLNWSPSAQGTYPIAGYAIYRETKPDEESTTPIATVDASTSSYTDTGITSGVTYYYHVRVFDNQNPPNYSLPSPEASASITDSTPPVISVLSPADFSTFSSSEVKLSGKVIDNLSGIDKVTVNGSLVSLSSDGSFNTIINLSEGLNKIMILAIDKAGNQTTKILNVIYEKPPQIITIQLQISNPLMTVNSVSQEIDPGRGTTPIIIKEWERTVVPIRAIVEALGGTIDWDGSTRKVTINFKNTTIELWIDNPKAKVDGKETWIDSDNHNVKPVIQNGRTMLPLRFVAESLGAKVDWDTDTKTITITYPKP